MEKTEVKRNLSYEEKGTRGITLIALVVTIIVLLILAGISISMIAGENGILNRAKEAKEKTEIATRRERADLDRIDELISEATSLEKTVEQVTDENPGKLEELDNEKIINSIEDLVFFAYDVTNGNNYEGQTVKLGLSLDFNSSKSYVEPYRTDYEKYGYDGELKTLLTSGEGFKTIGVTNNGSENKNKSFQGTFDGNARIIKNIYINKEKTEDDEKDLKIGLFGNNYGEIKDLGIENCNINGVLDSNGINTVMTGGVVGSNYGKINTCYVSGNIVSKAINTAKSRVGGISGSGCNIENCYNLATITGVGDKSSNLVGGISGCDNSNTVSLKNCYNMGELFVKSGNLAMVGGILGSFAHSNSVSDCFNIGNITLSDLEDKVYCGGVIGYGAGLELNNCHNNCEMFTSNLSDNGTYIGLIIGYGAQGSQEEKCSSKNCSSLKYNNFRASSEFDGDQSGLKVEDDEKDMPDILSILGDKFKMGTDGYPILKWQSLTI